MSRGINEHYPHLLGCTERDIYSVDDVQGCTWKTSFLSKVLSRGRSQKSCVQGYK